MRKLLWLLVVVAGWGCTNRNGDFVLDSDEVATLQKRGSFPRSGPLAHPTAIVSRADLAKALSAITRTKAGDIRVENVALSEIDRFYEKTQDVSSEFSGDDFDDKVVGEDDRLQITDTLSYPNRTFGQMSLGCTGTLVGPRHVLTAGHCVYDIEARTWHSALDFASGRNGEDTPFGTSRWAKVFTLRGWVESHETRYDIALVILDEAIGRKTGWMAFGYRPELEGLVVNVTGYPSDKPRGTMWRSHCPLTRALPEEFQYDCDTFNGNSGSSIYAYFKGQNRRVIYGVHTNGVTNFNWGTRITPGVFSVLKQWMAQNP